MCFFVFFVEYKSIPMKHKTVFFIAVFILSTQFVIAQSEPFSSRLVTTGLNFPWEIVYGPDGYLWVTERTDKQVTRVNTTTGLKTVAITINEVYQSAGQDGLLGMALHPELLQGTGNDYVYVAYTYDDDPGGGVNQKTKIRRYTYNSVSESLGSPLDLITNLMASNDHNSGRLVIGPDLKLYYTIGDQGNNQFGNMCSPIRAQDLPDASEVTAQDWTKYVGKILRLDLDGGIPSDNPLIAGVRSHIYSYGHRNAQGIVIAPDGKIYADEHGPKSDDEVNLVLPGKNYGWPHVAGYIDNQAYVYGNWSASSPSPCSSLSFSDYTIPSSVPTSFESSWSNPDFTPPIKTLFSVSNAYNFQDPACSTPTPNYFICWPTVAPSSIDIYTQDLGGIPGWANSLLVISLKEGRAYRMKLNTAGTGFVALNNGTDTASYFRTTNRYRDIAMNSDHRTFYISTDNSGSTSGPSSGWTNSLANPGAILEFQYTGVLLDLNDEPRAGAPVVNRNSILVYPNPAQSEVHISMKKNIRKPFKAEIYDLNGRMRKQTSSMKNEFTLDIANLNAGVYMIKISNGYDFEVHVGKIVKK